MSGPKSVFDSPRQSTVKGRAATKTNGLARKGKFKLAAACVDTMSDDDVAWWLREVMAGRDPDAKRDDKGNPIAPPGGFLQAPEWKDRMKAAEMFLNRRNGAPAASVLVEAELQVSGKIVHAALAPSQIAQMDPDRKALLRELLTKAVRGDLVPARGALPAAVEAARDANPPALEG